MATLLLVFRARSNEQDRQACAPSQLPSLGVGHDTVVGAVAHWIILAAANEEGSVLGGRQHSIRS